LSVCSKPPWVDLLIKCVLRLLLAACRSPLIFG
jgi:hypothetical protein